jgi:MerR family transcriptional regulator, light-induced transcriptional regulator
MPKTDPSLPPRAEPEHALPPPASPAGDDVAKATAGKVVALKPYPIGTAARLAGIPPETLRIWERRYQLLSPGRTGGGHRLYSEDDVALLRCVKVLVDAGMRIGAVARMEPARIREEAERLTPFEPTPIQAKSNALVEEIIAAARDLDERRTAMLLDRPLLVSPGEEVVNSLYLPLLSRVGDLWHAGRITIAVEHFVEKLITSRIHAILQATAQPGSGRLALCACPPDERHEVGLFAAALSLKSGGFPVTVLGADLPASDLAESAAATDPSVIVIAVTNSLSDGAKATLPAVLHESPCASIPLVVGGRQAESLTRLLRRPFVVVDRLDDLAGTVRRLTH